MKTKNRLIVIGLDAMDGGIANSLIAAGKMPNLARLKSASACWDLDHGRERDSGLAWEQFVTGRHPTVSNRWSSVDFDPHTYEVSQPEIASPPFTANLGVRTLAVDVPHYNMCLDPMAKGFCDWFCHDPNVPQISRPDTVLDEVLERFGPSPARKMTYDTIWPDPVGTIKMGRSLSASIAKRSDMFLWLAKERLTDFNLALLAVGEIHSAIETMWHGWDENHPLAKAPSAVPARHALTEVYTAADQLVGSITREFPTTQILVFSHHGMGKNTADVPAMALIPELLYRHSFGTKALTAGKDFVQTVNAKMATTAKNTGWWDESVNSDLNFSTNTSIGSRLIRSLLGGQKRQGPLDWMPTARYRHSWPKMKAFSLPSYTVGPIRVNLAGREASGLVPLDQYKSVLSEIVALLKACRTLKGGKALDLDIELTAPQAPLELAPSQADIVVRFNKPFAGLVHPDFGQIGPLPWRRTGGHTGGLGFAFLKGTDANIGHHGTRSTFDLAEMTKNAVI